jgi:hypothetical protein
MKGFGNKCPKKWLKKLEFAHLNLIELRTTGRHFFMGPLGFYRFCYQGGN